MNGPYPYLHGSWPDPHHQWWCFTDHEKTPASRLDMRGAWYRVVRIPNPHVLIWVYRIASILALRSQVIIAHNTPIVGQYSKRVIVMGEGNILADGPTVEVLTQSNILEAIFLEPPQITQLAQPLQDKGFDPGTLIMTRHF